MRQRWGAEARASALWGKRGGNAPAAIAIGTTSNWIRAAGVCSNWVRSKWGRSNWVSSDWVQANWVSTAGVDACVAE
jgi:hypothetical protein